MIYGSGVCEDSQRRCQKGAGGNAIAMTNRSVLEFQARAWGPWTLLHLLFLSNHSTASCTCIFFPFALPDLICSSEYSASPRLKLLSVEYKGTDSVLNIYKYIYYINIIKYNDSLLINIIIQGRATACAHMGWKQKFHIQACAELPSPIETVLAFAFRISLLAPEMSSGQRQCEINI